MSETMDETTDGMLGAPRQAEMIEGIELDDTAITGPGSEVRRTAIATAVTVGIGAATFEAALLPGVLLGVAAMWLPHDVRQAFSPLVKSTVRGVYRLGERTGDGAKALITDMRQQVREIVAEVDAENSRVRHAAS
jgi:hypothetical protein